MPSKSAEKQTQEIHQLRKALKFVWGQNKSKAERIRILNDDKQDLLNKEESENLTTIKILKKQLFNLSSDLNFSGRRYEELMEKFNRNQKVLSKVIQRYKIAQVFSLIFFMGASVLIWQTYRANTYISTKKVKIAKLELSNHNLSLENEELAESLTITQSNLKKKYESKIVELSQKNNSNQTKQIDLEKQASINLNGFQKSINELKHEHRFRLNLLKNDYTNTIQLLTAKVSVANDQIHQLEVKSRDVIFITKQPDITPETEIKSSQFLDKIVVPVKEVKVLPEHTGNIKMNSLTDFLRKLGASVINDEPFLPQENEQKYFKLKQKF
ncbi:MAG: hypothetical protein COA79_06310 [Planctomycetota bacterium]|nr:MAG: hypothetical protein COA79_06310 [Planctomycetota bacterium]